MKTKLLALALLAGGSVFAQTRFSISVGGYGPAYYPAPPYARAIVPPCPGPEYLWVDGYWMRDGARPVWVDGYWNRRPYREGYVVAPRYGDAYRGERFSRGFETDRYRENGREWRHDDHDRGRYGDRHGNGFRDR